MKPVNLNSEKDSAEFCEESAVFVEKLRCFTRNIEHERQIAKGEIVKLERSVRELERIISGGNYNLIDIDQGMLIEIKVEFGNVRDYYSSTLKIYQNIIMAMSTFSEEFTNAMGEYEHRDILVNDEIDRLLATLPKVPSKDAGSVPE